VIVDYVQNEQNVEKGEWFYTSGDDRIFPKGLPVGPATVVRQGRARKEIQIDPQGLRNGLEEVLIVVDGVHRALPDAAPDTEPTHLLDAPPPEPGDSPATVETGPRMTDADRLMERYRKTGSGADPTGPSSAKAPAPAAR